MPNLRNDTRNLAGGRPIVVPVVAGLLALGAACAPPAKPGANDHLRAPELLLGQANVGASASLSRADSAWVEQTLRSLTLREKVGQLIMPWVGGEYAAVGSPEFEQVRKWVEEDRVGGLIISIGLPHSYAAKLNHMQRRARVPLLIGSDMENGTGMRLANSYALPSLLPQGGGTVFPPVMALGATGSPELAQRLGEVLGREARAVGVHVTFGPVLDVNANPLNPIINTRSFGEDPALVSRLAAAYIRGARSAGLMTTGKHFPGHGDTETDSHIALPTIRATRAHLDSVDLPPFRAAVTEGVDAIMTAHIAVTGVEGPQARPATLSPYFMTGVLRRDLRFAGLLFTDAMTMGGVANRYGAAEPLILALEAGADVLLMPRSVPAAIATVHDAVQKGRISEARIDESVRRILVAKARAGLRTGRLVDLGSVDQIVNIPAHAAVARQIAERSITLPRDKAGAVPLRPEHRRILSLTYAEVGDLLASRVFNQELRRAGYDVAAVPTDARTTSEEVAKLRARADSFDVVLASFYVSPRDGRSSIAAEGPLTSLIEEMSRRGKRVVALAFGSPYLLGSFPSVPSLLLAWGGAPVAQRAAASALLGYSAISGRLPVALPPYHKVGEGIQRPVSRTASQ